MKEIVESCKEKARKRLDKQLERAETMPVVVFENDDYRRPTRRAPTQEEIDARKAEYTKCYEEYIRLLDDLEDFLEDSREYIDPSMYEEWKKVVIQGVSEYADYGLRSPKEDYYIEGIISSAKILKTLKRDGIEKARELFTANSNSDLWDYDAKLVIKFGGQKGIDCYKSSERYNQKINNSSEEFRKEINDVLTGKSKRMRNN